MLVIDDIWSTGVSCLYNVVGLSDWRAMMLAEHLTLSAHTILIPQIVRVMYIYPTVLLVLYSVTAVSHELQYVCLYTAVSHELQYLCLYTAVSHEMQYVCLYTAVSHELQYVCLYTAVSHELQYVCLYTF